MSDDLKRAVALKQGLGEFPLSLKKLPRAFFLREGILKWSAKLKLLSAPAPPAEKRKRVAPATTPQHYQQSMDQMGRYGHASQVREN